MIAPLLSFFGRFRQSKTDSITATVSVFGRFRQPKIDDMKVLIGDWGVNSLANPNREIVSFRSCVRAGGGRAELCYLSMSMFLSFSSRRWVPAKSDGKRSG